MYVAPPGLGYSLLPIPMTHVMGYFMLPLRGFQT
jgi:hypothetical protein